jgi:hypothetical protein
MPKNSNEYDRNYRRMASVRKHQKAVREGVALSVKLLRLSVGQATVTGLEAALMLERTLLGPVSTRFVISPPPNTALV